jgi:hemerythrin superfamily protein
MPGDVVDLIMQDHRELERIFDELMSSPEKRPTLVPLMISLLSAHSRAEEAEVYPAARESGGDEDVEHSQKEHLEADQLAAEVAATDPTSDDFTQVLSKLVDAVKHHVEEEESTVLPHMKERMDDERRRALGDAFLTSRQEHLGEQPGELTKSELEQQASNAGVSGARGMSKDQLEDRLKQEAES